MPPALLAPANLDWDQLARRAARGDASALEALAQHVQPLLEGHARRALGRRASGAVDVDDLVQEVTAEVQAFLLDAEGAPGWRRYEAARARGEVGAWLFGIVRNKVRRRLRDQRRREQLAPETLEEPAAEGLSPDRALDAERALKLARTLPSREREALALWLTDASSREIAARLRFASPHAVDCCLARGKQRLRRLMLGDDLPLAA